MTEPIMRTTDQNCADREIQELLARRLNAISKKDVAGVLACGTPDIAIYSLAPPLVSSVDGGEGLRAWFATWQGQIGLSLANMTVVAEGDVAFAHGLAHLTGTKSGGERVDLWFRETFGLRKVEGTWLIVHDHESVPFYMDGSFRAAVDLAPKAP
jgi:ketosteroid isomerase-like protein